MTDVYDKQRTASLINEVRQLTADLKTEVKEIQMQMGRVLEGDEDEKLDAPESEMVADDPDLLKAAPPKFFWRFWR